MSTPVLSQAEIEKLISEMPAPAVTNQIRGIVDEIKKEVKEKEAVGNSGENVSSGSNEVPSNEVPSNAVPSNAVPPVDADSNAELTTEAPPIAAPSGKMGGTYKKRRNRRRKTTKRKRRQSKKRKQKRI